MDERRGVEEQEMKGKEENPAPIWRIGGGF
jgi:hypothetical protein